MFTQLRLSKNLQAAAPHIAEPRNKEIDLKATTTIQRPIGLVPLASLDSIDELSSVENNQVGKDTWSKIDITLAFIAACYALREGSSSIMGSEDAGINSFVIVLIVSLVTTITTFLLINAPTRRARKDILRYLKKGDLPNDWPVELTKSQERVAKIVAIPPILWGIGLECIQAFFFLYAMHDVSILKYVPNSAIVISSILIASGAGYVTTCTESWGTFEMACRVLARDLGKFESNLNKTLSFIAGGLFGAIKASQDALQALVAIKATFKIKERALLSVVGAGCMLTGVTFFCFTGMQNIMMINEFLDYLRKKKFEPMKVAAFLGAFSLAAFVSYFKRYLYLSFNQEIAESFDIKHIPETAFIGFSYAMLFQDITLGSGLLYRLIYDILESGTNKLQEIKELFDNFVKPPTEETERRPLYNSTNAKFRFSYSTASASQQAIEMPVRQLSR